MPPLRSQIAAVSVALALLAGVRLVDAAPSCATSCVGRMVSCRAERCPGSTGKDRRHCRDVCRAVTGCAAGGPRIRTLATVVNECRAADGLWTARQRLEIRRGDCPPVTVMTVEGNAPVVDLELCQIYGDARDGSAGMSIGAFQGVAVSPDGETVLFQVTDDFIGRIIIGGFTIPTPSFTPPAEGIFVVRADGTGIARISGQSREAPFVIRPGPGFPGIRVLGWGGFFFSPDGKSVIFADRGPGTDGSDAPQLFTLDPHTGVRRQLTRFTASSVGMNPDGVAVGGLFLDDRRIGGFVFDSTAGPRIFRMRRDGTDLRYLEAPTPIPGARVVPSFRVTGLTSDVFSLTLDQTTNQPEFGLGSVAEIFFRDGENILQLTQLGRSDTGQAFRLRDREHVVFAASGDPLRQNPSLTCQLFSIDRFGGHLRQLTRFDPGATSPSGCLGGYRPPGCTVTEAIDVQDPVTGAIVFDASCDPFGLSAVSQQLYAVRPDGSGVRQLTDYRGVTTQDGTLSVELPGPMAYSAPQK